MEKILIINDEIERKKSIVDNTPAIFEINDNPTAVGSRPFYELESMSQVNKWRGLIMQIAKRYSVDYTLLIAIMYMETTHGWYDKFYPARKTVLPMNLHYHYWRKLGVTKENLNCPYYNIEFGAILLSRIKARIKNPTIAKIATLYNYLGAEKVTNYGARVARIYLTQPWRK